MVSWFPSHSYSTYFSGSLACGETWVLVQALPVTLTHWVILGNSHKMETPGVKISTKRKRRRFSHSYLKKSWAVLGTAIIIANIN